VNRKLEHAQDVAELAALLELMEGFSSNEQRARYLLGTNWFRDRAADAAARIDPEVDRVRRAGRVSRLSIARSRARWRREDEAS
jgi:cytochrome c-type biogenesis protein CcmH/NrfG